MVFTQKYFQEQGRTGGQEGGAKRWEGVSPEERTRLAKQAVAAREAKRRARGTKPT